MSTPANYNSAVPANSEFLGMASAIFDTKKDASWTALAKVVPIGGVALELDAVGPSPAVRKMQASRRFSNLRAYVQQLPVEVYSADALELRSTIVLGDKSGMVQRRLSDYLSNVSNFFEKPVIETLLSNPMGIDKVSLFNDSHPFGANGGTWDNKTTDVFSQAALEAGYVAMRTYKFENGEPGGFAPTCLVVSPKYERAAKDLLGTTRIIPVSNAGVSDATSGVTAAGVLPNWLEGKLQLIVLDRMYDGTHDDDWFIADLSRPDVRPLAVGELRAPRGVVIDRPDSEAMVNRSSFQYYVDAEAAIGGYAPQTVYGRMS